MAFARTRTEVRIDTREAAGPLPHIWEECAGSDRAAITMRESWRKDLERWKQEAGLKRVRFHGIFNDEMGVFAPSILTPKPKQPNFRNVDEVYDGLVARGVSPFIELGFMPKVLASGTRSFGFYNANVSPPASMDAWADFIKAFVGHLADRYGLEAVRTWPFEVWNEPDLPFFWGGDQQKYFELYKATAVAVKSIDPALTVGGPATSGSHWLSEFTAWCGPNNAPVDFITTHMYAGGDQKKDFGPDSNLAQADVIPEAMRLARQKIDRSSLKGRPLWLSEWSSDSPAMIAHVIAGCLPYCQAMSQWTLSATYEELGVNRHLLKESDTAWGMMVRGIAKPSFNTYKLLHRLGSERLNASGPTLASRTAQGRVSALVWNLADVNQATGNPYQDYQRVVKGEAKQLVVEFAGARPGQKVRVSYVDQERGSPMPAWRKLGSPEYIKMADIELLRKSAEIPAPEIMRLDAARRLTLDLPPEGVALVELA
jgi:xylan 1,4-beta-xylosidase